MDTRNPIREEQAFIEGQEAGHLEVRPGANRYEPGTPEHASWERGRAGVEARRIALGLNTRVRKFPCRYRAEIQCNCEGRGFCLDVA